MAGATIEFKFYIKLICLCVFAIASIFAGSFLFYQLFSHKNNVTRAIKIAMVILMFIVLGIAYNYFSFEEEYEKYVYDEENKTAQNSTNNNVTNASDSEKNGIDVLKATATARIENRLIIGALGEYVAAPYNFEELSKDEKKRIVIGDGLQVETLPATVNRDRIFVSDNQKIDRIMNGTLEDTYFKVYKDEVDDKFFVYFYNENDSFKNQLKFYLTVLLHYPQQVCRSYHQNYWNIIFLKEGDFSPYERENFNIPSKIYTPRTSNIVDVNESYEQFVKEYRCDIEQNTISGLLNGYMNTNIHRLITLMELALWHTPFMLICSVLMYIIFKILRDKKYITQEKMNLLQFIIILYTTTYGGIMSYVVLGATVDRYVIPMTVTAFIAYFLFALLILDYTIVFVQKNILKSNKKTTHKKTKHSKHEYFA